MRAHIPVDRMLRYATLLSLALFSLAVAPLATAAQSSVESPATFTLTGSVVDIQTQSPVPGARVRLGESNRAILTDSEGRFHFEDVKVGTRSIHIDNLGYAPLTVTVEFAAGDVLAVELEPMPVVLEGLKVMADRLESRRRSAPRPIHVIDRDDFALQPQDAYRVVQSSGVVKLQTCRVGFVTRSCIRFRGRTIEPEVYIDQGPPGTVNDLRLMRTDEIYAIEIQDRGAVIHVYTRTFMDRAARNPAALGHIMPSVY